MPLKAGSKGNLSYSMTEDIENAFKESWKSYHDGNELPEIGENERRMIFIAVAKGVLKHLKEHLGESLTINVSVRQDSGSDELIKSKNKSVVNLLWSGLSYSIPIDAIEVTQVSEPIKSSGEATVEEVIVEDLP